MKKISTLLTAILLITTTATAQNATFDFTTGTGTGTGWSFNATFGTLQIQSNADIRITGEIANGDIYVSNRTNVKITLDGVNITKTSAENAFYAYESDITLTLVGENTLSGSSNGIRLATNALLTINGDGRLNAIGDDAVSTRGGINFSNTGAVLNIDGGVVFASGIKTGVPGNTVNYNCGIVFVGGKLVFNGYGEKISDLTADTLRLFTQVQELEADTTQLKSTIRDFETQVAELESDTANQNTIIAGLNSEVSGLKIDTANLNKQVADLKADTLAKGILIAQLEEALENCPDGDYVEQLEIEIAGLRIDTINLNKQVADLKADTIKLNILIEALKLDTVKLNDSIKKLLIELADCLNSGTSNANLIPQEHIQVFPNPVSYELRIVNYDFKQGELVELFDINGRRVYSARANGNEMTIDMSNFQSGNYILRIGNRVARIVKQ
jgi:uncharacterized coiled-coil protein SlyX